MSIENIINFGNISKNSGNGDVTLPKKIYECCDCCGIVTSDFENILKIECECCDEKNKKEKGLNICINCVKKYKLIGFEHCKDKYPKIFKYINSVKYIRDKSKTYSYIKNELDTITKQMLYKNRILNNEALYKKINDYDDLDQSVYTYITLEYKRNEIFEIDNFGLYVFNNYYCNDCIKEKCVFFCPLHNKMAIDKNKNNKDILNLHMIDLELNEKCDLENHETSIYRCPYVHKLLDIFVYEV
jgi:hypothetical protein